MVVFSHRVAVAPTSLGQAQGRLCRMYRGRPALGGGEMQISNSGNTKAPIVSRGLDPNKLILDAVFKRIDHNSSSGIVNENCKKQFLWLPE
jgi:hypothetical protein